MQFGGFGFLIVWIIVMGALLSIGPLLVNWRFSSSIRADISVLRRDMTILSEKLDRLQQTLEDSND
jgi:hypothetical protein